jgi:hypothetical protein
MATLMGFFVNQWLSSFRNVYDSEAAITPALASDAPKNEDTPMQTGIRAINMPIASL